mgnify:CR=1 FL=1
MRRKLEQIIDIIMDIKKIKSEAKVAGVLEMTPQAFNRHKVRGTLPVDQLIDFCEREGVPLSA